MWHSVKAAIPHIIKGGRGGAIVLTSSVGGLRGAQHIGHYIAAKHGVVGLLRTLALELGQYGIRVNTVHPTQVNTPMLMNDRTYRAFRPDLENPTAEDFAPISRPAMTEPWKDALLASAVDS
ncbi:hypothetical protein GCM10010191_08420 [Actinomadura vinacea]|uniref:SDR family NAD(P)-dependent oxidoreductase n=1 Tax=Actinomadura vinacea TaxID=115336 RepID=A0ABN3IF74_9ACTN